VSRASKPNLLFLLADQLRAASVPAYGDRSVQMPNLDALAREGVTFTQALSTCPLCTPYRAMLLTGRHPQSTGHVANFVDTRHDEISIADAFNRAGYRTGWVGKWHLALGHFPVPHLQGPDFIPQGRDRLGFEYFRAYNYRTEYFDGWVGLDDWDAERWQGYETDGLLKYAFEFLDRPDERPFCLFVSPHQPHQSDKRPTVPEKYFDRVAQEIMLPPNVAEGDRDRARKMLRDYLAMTAAVDDMLGALVRRLAESGQLENTLVVFASDHGTMGGGHGYDPWCKKQPYEESIRVPLVARWPGALRAGSRCDALIAPVDLFPTLCGLAGAPIPRSVEGLDLSRAWRGEPGGPAQDAVLTMDFTAHPDYCVAEDDPRRKAHYEPWRGVRTARHHFIRWLGGRTALYDVVADPWQMRNLAGDPACAALQRQMESQLGTLLARRGDRLQSGAAYAGWFDARRRIVRNAFGPLPHPETPPDLSLFP